MTDLDSSLHVMADMNSSKSGADPGQRTTVSGPSKINQSPVSGATVDNHNRAPSLSLVSSNHGNHPRSHNGADHSSLTSRLKTDGVHACEMCPRTFLNKKDFLLHQYNHKEKSTLIYCAYCYKNFTSECAFKKHNKLHEKKKTKVLLCTICGSEFEYVKDLEEHHRKLHLNEKLFRCEHCEATFSWRENLNKHMRMHATPTVTHKCDQCQRTFMDNTSLRLHQCTQKQKTAKEEKPFICKLCDKAFQFDFSFKAHLNSHEGPVALSAWKSVEKKKMLKKSAIVNEAAAIQLKSVLGEGALPDRPPVNSPKQKMAKVVSTLSRSVASSISPVASSNHGNTAAGPTPMTTSVTSFSTYSNTAQTITPVPLPVPPILSIPMNPPVKPHTMDSSDSSTSLGTKMDGSGENLKEIVLEIVEVNELPQGGGAQGVQVLARGPPNADTGPGLMDINVESDALNISTESEMSNPNTSGLIARIDMSCRIEPVDPEIRDGTMFIEIDPISGQRLPKRETPESNLPAMTISTSGQVMSDVRPPEISVSAVIDPALCQSMHSVQSFDIPTPVLTPLQTFSSMDYQNEDCSHGSSRKVTETPPVLEVSTSSPKTVATVHQIPPTLTLFAGVADTAQEQSTEEKDGKTEKKKSKRPLLYDYVMTEETPFQCPQCFKEFRWEISLNIHLQEHMGVPSNRYARNKKMSKKQKTGGDSSSIHASKIVRRRASSDEEEDIFEQADFEYGANVVKKKRGRPRKYPAGDIEITGVQPPKRKRGRPPKVRQVDPDPVIQHLENSNETVIIRVTRGVGESQYHIKQEEASRTEQTAPATSAVDSSRDIINIPKHQLIRFYLLRQLKLSRYRGFYPCRFCSKPFSCKASLNMHILRHTGKGSYLCKHCGQKFPDHRTLVLHCLIEEEEQTTTGPYQCATCCRICSSANGLSKHMRRHLANAWPSSRPRVKQASTD